MNQNTNTHKDNGMAEQQDKLRRTMRHIEGGMVYDRVTPLTQPFLKLAHKHLEREEWAVVLVWADQPDLWIVDMKVDDPRLPGTYELERLYNTRLGREPYTPVSMTILNYGLTL